MDDLQTPRLILKPLAIEDADAIQRLFAHWEVVQHRAVAVSGRRRVDVHPRHRTAGDVARRAVALDAAAQDGSGDRPVHIATDGFNGGALPRVHPLREKRAQTVFAAMLVQRQQFLVQPV